MEEHEEEIKMIGRLTYKDTIFNGYIIFDHYHSNVEYFEFNPDLSKSEMTISGNPNKMEDTIISIDGEEVVRWTADEIKEDDTSEDIAKEMYDLYHTDMEEFRGRVFSLISNMGDDTFFDKILEEDDVEVEFHEFLDSITDDI